MGEIRYLLIGDGTSPHMVKWVRELVKYFNVFLISSRGIHPELSAFLPSGHLFPLNLSLRQEGGNLPLIFETPKVFSIIRKIKPSVVNAHYITSHGLLAALVSQLSSGNFFLVQSAWGTDILVTPFVNGFYRIAARYSLNRAQLVTSDSEFMTGVIKKLTRTQVLTFTFGLDQLPDFNPGLKRKGLFYSNRILSENYNVGEVLKFFNRVAADDKNARLVVANDGDLRESLQELSRHLKIDDRVTFTGFIPPAEQVEMFKKAEYFISIPSSDSTSVSLLEAMAYGCIPILSDIPANNEWITDGKGGMMYSDNLGFSDLEEFRMRQPDAIALNRKIIQEKAIFPDAMLSYSLYISNHLEER